MEAVLTLQNSFPLNVHFSNASLQFHLNEVHKGRVINLIASVSNADLANIGETDIYEKVFLYRNYFSYAVFVWMYSKLYFGVYRNVIVARTCCYSNNSSITVVPE